MAIYPKGEDEAVINSEALSGVVEAIFMACGMPQQHASILTRSLVEADLRGVHSHGVLRVPDYVGKLTTGGVNPAGAPRVRTEAAAAVVVDGDNTMGQVGGTFAMEEAIARARLYGVGVAALGHSNHSGTMDFFTRMAVEAGCIGIATTNALPTMAPWGGREKIVGINPLSIGMPTDGPHPLIMDMAFGATAHGKIRVYAQKGVPIPEGWALDANGSPTTDATAALDGLIRPIGAFKGVAMAVMTGALSTLLSGAAYGTELGNMHDGPRPGADGQFFAALNIASLQDEATFKRRAGDIIRQLCGCALAPGTTRIYPPGSLEYDVESRSRREGISLAGETLRAISREANRLGISVAALGASVAG